MWSSYCLCQGYRTGHIYRDAATGHRYGRSSSEADIAAKKLSLANDIAALSSYVYLSQLEFARIVL